MKQLSIHDARRLAVISQALHKTRPFGSGNNAPLACLEQLGYVQIDTISIINRSQHQTFRTRIPSYQGGQLDHLQKHGKIFEYWHHAAAYLPMQDYRYYRRYMNAIASGEKHWWTPDQKQMQYCLDRIQSEGPLMAKNFEPPPDAKKGDWWELKPAKRALDQLWIEGKLMISHRLNFHKVYDIPERVLPPDIETTAATESDFFRFLILRAIWAHGVVNDSEISYLRKGVKPGVRKQIKQMLANGEIVEVNIKNQSTTYYSIESKLNELDEARIDKKLHFLSPFDNAVIQRKRLLQLFDYDYQIECYTPAAKRKYGYYCLPILYGADFIGRLDPKADRKAKKMIIKNIYLENGVNMTERLLYQFCQKLRELANFNECEHIEIQGQDSPVRQEDILRCK